MAPTTHTETPDNPSKQATKAMTVVDLQNMTVPEDIIKELGDKIAEHPTLSHHSSPAVLSRMLLARHLNVQDAYVLWEAWAAWREKHQPQLIEEAHVAPQLAVQTVSIAGQDKNGRTCVLLRTRNHVPGQFPFEEMLRLTIYVLETSTTRSVKTSGTGYITAVWDCNGQGYRNLDAALATAKPGIISIMKVCVVIGGLKGEGKGGSWGSLKGRNECLNSRM